MQSLLVWVSAFRTKERIDENEYETQLVLDPASPGFDYSKSHKRLAISDADYVQIIHTDSKKYGFAKPLGHGTCYINASRDLVL